MITNKIVKLSDQKIKQLVNDLIKQMTLSEKIGQLFQSSYNGSAITGPEFDNSECTILIEKGLVGSIIGQYDNTKIIELQKKAIEKSRLKIPLLFCNDIIHGCRTMLPINLAMSCSWNPDLVEEAIKVVAYEAGHSGVQLTFSPMVDLVRDPRWGRVMEANGEDPYLSQALTRAYVKGYQGDLLSENTIGCCLKHFIGYGACEGGRDYNSVMISEEELYQNYLPPFKAGIDEGALMVMTSFNTLNSIPMTMNKHLLKNVLRKEIKFKGVIISDYTSTFELIKHKTAKDKTDVAKKCIEATLDIEMIATTYLDSLSKLVEEGKISEQLIDEACKRVLTLKYKLGLFNNPYKNIYQDYEKYWLKKEHLAISLKIAEESICLLKNDQVLPLNKNELVAFIGPFVKEKAVIGAWGGKGRIEDTITIYDALKEDGYPFKYALGTNIVSSNNKDLQDAISLINDNPDIKTVVITIGEHQWMSGECHCRANINIPVNQEELIDHIIAIGKKVILLVMAGRPLILTKYKEKVAGIIYGWFLGTMSGRALINVLYGKTNPSGKLTMSFPYEVGQIPVYYNHLPTGRPLIENESPEYKMKYDDIPVDPLYHFGYGLSYAKFIYHEIELSSEILTDQSPVIAKIKISNEADCDGMEVVQLYIESTYSQISRPVKELKHFKKVLIPAHNSIEVAFEITKKDLEYYYHKVITEEGYYKIYIGPSSETNIFKQVLFKK